MTPPWLMPGLTGEQSVWVGVSQDTCFNFPALKFCTTCIYDTLTTIVQASLKQSCKSKSYKFKHSCHSIFPLEYKWLQQQIPACRPVFTSCHAAIGFFIIGVIFLALGIAFLVVAMRVCSLYLSIDSYMLASYPAILTFFRLQQAKIKLGWLGTRLGTCNASLFTRC